MISRAIILTLVFCLSSQVFAGESEDPFAGFDLLETQVADLTVRYESSLSLELEAIRQALSDFLKQGAKNFAQVDDFKAKSDEIIEQVNAIVGFSPTEEQKANQAKILSTFLGIDTRLAKPGQKTTIYLLTMESTKEYLRKGGSLPGFTYDKENDRAGYNLVLAESRSIEPEGERQIAVPIPAQGAAKHFAGFLTALETQQLVTNVGSALHELVEGTILLYRLKPRDPYFRWFSDGFANAITVHLLKANVGEQAATECAETHDTKKYAALEKQINLRYWMGLGYCIETPLESEKQLNYARYAYATLEATRLIDKHGIECVAKILDKACKNASGNNSRELIPAIEEVTGEDMEKRFLRYQTFETKEQGIAQYAKSSNAAVDQKDYGKALPCLLRIHELRGMGDPLFYRNAAFLLFRMGQEEAGDQIMLSHADFCKERGLEPAYVTMHALFITYARMCNNLAKATASAEIVLKSKPDYVPALAVRMVKLRSAGDIEEAKKIAQRILNLEQNPQNPWRKLAEDHMNP